MIALRTVDKAMKWVLQAEKDERLVPSFGAEIVGEVEAHVAYAAELNNTISVREKTIRDREKEIVEFEDRVVEKDAIIDKMAAELEKRGMHHSAIRVLRDGL